MALPLLAVAGIGTGASLLSQGIGGLFSARARRRARRARREAAAEAGTLYGRRIGEDALQRGSAQSALESVREHVRQAAQRRRGQQVVSGGTSAAGAAGKEADASAVAKTASGIVASNDARVDRLEALQQGVRTQLAQQEAAAQEAQAAETAAAARGVVGAIGNAATVLAAGDGTAKDISSGGVELSDKQRELLNMGSKKWNRYYAGRMAAGKSIWD